MDQVVTIQKTSKGIKLAQLVFFALFIVGSVKTCAAAGSNVTPGAGVGLMLLGGLGVLVARILAWWRHG